MLQWLVPISISRVTYIKMRSHLCLFEKRVLTTSFELPKETLRITTEISQDAHGIKIGILKLKICSSFIY